MITPETEAMFVARFLQREATSKQTIAVKAEEKARGHDWVVPTDVVGCTEIIAVCREIEELRRDIAKRTELQLQAVTNALDRALRAEGALSKEQIACGQYMNALVDTGRRAKKAEAALAEAVLIIRDLRMHADGATSIATLEAASAFAAKHGGRDG